jgi:hypothetical protein
MLNGKANDAKCEKCTGDYAKCRMDVTFAIEVYMKAADMTTAKKTSFVKAVADSMGVYPGNVSLVSVAEGASLYMSKVTKVTVKVSLGKDTDNAKKGGDSADPSFNPTTIQTNLATEGITTGSGGDGRFEIGNMLGFDMPTYAAIKGILDQADAYKVELTVQITSTKADFTEEKQVSVGAST